MYLLSYILKLHKYVFNTVNKINLWTPISPQMIDDPITLKFHNSEQKSWETFPVWSRQKMNFVKLAWIFGCWEQPCGQKKNG